MSPTAIKAPAPDRVQAYTTITEATMALGNKTYSGTVAGGVEGPPPANYVDAR